MRLKRSSDLTQVEFCDATLPPYAILSHTWGADEVTFSDVYNDQAKDKSGFSKILFCGRQAYKDGLEYFWIDTCCIDKTSSSELTEAINSAFRWYREAKVCYVYLSDVSIQSSKRKRDDFPETWESSFRNSRWFTRGWTLQELLAPQDVVFFSKEFVQLGTKTTLEALIHQITTIPIDILRGVQPLYRVPVKERFRWAERRQTTRVEDRAYSLLGIFNIHMPIIYGEEDNAFQRLQQEIQRQSSYAEHIYVNSTSEPNREAAKFRLDDTAYGSDYHPLTESEFRLLTLDPGIMGGNITGQLRVHELSNPPAYYALSYVWGTEPSIHRIVINGGEHWIQPNLFNALQRVRLQRGRYSVWVDTVCINHADSSERNNQVKQMSTIYSSASSVLIWLGEGDSTSKLAVEFMTEITSDKFQWGTLSWEESGFTALTQMLERAWFRRAWVLQKAAFSHNSIILCGDSEIYMDYFITAIRTIQDRLNTASLSSSQTLEIFHESSAIRLIDAITGALRKSAKGELIRRKMSLETLVYRSTHSETTDQRDTIYALLNLANDLSSLRRSNQGDSIVPDYNKPVLDVFADFVLHCCVQSGQLDVICRPWAPALAV